MSRRHGPRIDAGWLRGARRLPSDNANERPPGTAVDLLVIHNISLPPGRFGGGFVEQLFLNCSSMLAITLTAEPQRTQLSTSMPKTRFSRCAQLIATCRSIADFSG